jgi:hypothetical protein
MREASHVPFTTLVEKREKIKDCLVLGGSICREVLKNRDNYPSKRLGEKKFYASLVSESLEYMRCMENKYHMSTSSIQITYANGLTGRVSICEYDTHFAYFYEQDDHDYHIDFFNVELNNNSKCKRYLLVELLDYIDSVVEKYGGIYEVVFYISVWEPLYKNQAYPLKLIATRDISIIYSYGKK